MTDQDSILRENTRSVLALIHSKYDLGKFEWTDELDEIEFCADGEVHSSSQPVKILEEEPAKKKRGKKKRRSRKGKIPL